MYYQMFMLEYERKTFLIFYFFITINNDVHIYNLRYLRNKNYNLQIYYLLTEQYKITSNEEEFFRIK